MGSTIWAVHHVRQSRRFLLGNTRTDEIMASAIEKYEENVTSKRCGRATFTECVPLPPEARGLNASTAGSHKTYNSWRARSCFEHTKQAKVGGQSAGPKACLALLAERKQQRMLSRRRERPPFKRFVSLSGPHAETARRLWKLVNLAGNGYFRVDDLAIGLPSKNRYAVDIVAQPCL